LGIQRTPGGHPEGYLEAFANIYRAFGDAIRGADGAPGWATMDDTLAGMRFIDACVASSAKGAVWVKI
jgi:predicted dehydrogenase